MTRPRTRPSNSHREEESRHLFQEYRRTQDPQIREQLVLGHEGLVRFLATRFAGRGEPLEDIIQIAWIGLIHAIDRFDPDRGTSFATYATPTIVGEIQHYLRDKRCSMRIPRALQELNWRVYQANESLSQRLGRSPTVSEIAEYLEVTEEEILEVMEVMDARKMVSLESEILSDGEASPLTIEDVLGGVDQYLEHAETFHDLKDAVARLARREQRVISLRFFHGLSQAEVAKRLNLSQMHISRLQQRALNRLRELLTPPDGGEGDLGLTCNLTATRGNI